MKANRNDPTTRVKIAVYSTKINVIQEVVADYFGIPKERMQRHRRYQVNAKPRNYTYYLSRKLVPHCPLAVLGILCGNGSPYDHATVSHATRKIESELRLTTRQGEPVYRELLKDIAILTRRISERFSEMGLPDVRYCNICGQVIIDEK